MSCRSASFDSSYVIQQVDDLSTVILNYFSKILTSATIFCFMNFFMAITAQVSAQVIKQAGRVLSQCCFSIRGYQEVMILWEFQAVSTGKLFRLILNSLVEVDFSA